ncbi:hypothetical protein [Candidatus Tokpelaia sp.]|uniref:hypothetical protein n=1 Tax=Candidatus Tokpelaia sp. TaxID=2233777 RepID=UPI00123904BB|nr:hypothetical protein [Candidatus Tokpelaia sp.]KAA6404493.1 hypothetical protein DPQ22_09690 [Candidatus Tokpelaia sp.]
MSDGMKVNDVYLDEVRCALLAVEEFVGETCTVEEYPADFGAVNPNHFVSLLRIINRHLQLAIEKPEEHLTAGEKL